MKTEKLEEINGYEIIDFLNKETRDNEDLCDISIVGGSFVFKNQEVEDNKYNLGFTAFYNNWGTKQAIPGNTLHITKDSVWFSLEEPFEGDGTDEELSKILTEWLKTHEFSRDSEKMFYSILNEVYEKVPLVTFSEKTQLQSIIDKLVRAKTLMK